jgi:hypothetical protein
MLFLAVFCGFLAENFREHRVEAHREKQYAVLLSEDIKSDTAMLSRLNREYEFVIPRIDTFQDMVNTKPLEAYPSGTWYYYGRFGTRNFTPVFQDASLTQLKSSGSLRYFRKQESVNAIAHYDQACRDLVGSIELQNYTYSAIILARNKIFNAYYMNEIMSMDISSEKVDSFKLQNIPLLSHDQNDLIQYASLCQLRSYNNKGNAKSCAETLKKAIELLAILKKNYDLE